MQFHEVATGFKFLEAGRAKSDGTLLFSDYARGGIHRLSSTGALEQWANDLRSIGGLVENDDGRLLLTGAGGIWLLDLDNDHRTRVPITLEAQRCFNDVESDGAGGFYVGTIDLVERAEQRPPAYGELLHVAADGSVNVFARDIGAANGIGIDAERGLLYLSDTGTGVWQFSIPSSGVASDRQLICDLEDSDGLTVDSTGAIWVAGWKSGTINRIDPNSYEITTFRVPAGQAMTLAFGGNDLRDLYVFGGSDVTDPGSPATASIYRASAPSKGVQSSRTSIRTAQANDPMETASHQSLSGE